MNRSPKTNPGSVQPPDNPVTPNATLRALAAEGFLSQLSFGLISFALPLYARELGMSLPQIGFLISLHLAVAVPLKPFAGRIVDRIGSRQGLLIALLLRGGVTLLLGFAAMPWHLFAIRATHGLSKSLRPVSASALIAEKCDRRKIASSFAWYQTSKSLAGSLGKALAGVLLGLTALRFTLVFALAFGLAALALVVVYRLIPNDRVRPEDRLPQGGENSKAPEPVAPAAAPRKALGRGTLVTFMGMAGLVSGTGRMLQGLFPLLAVEYAGLGEAQIGSIYLATSVIVLISGPLFGWLADRGHQGLVLGFRSVSNILSSLFYYGLPNTLGMFMGNAFDSAGKAAFRPAWGSIMARVSDQDPARRGRLLGLMSMGEDFGQVVGPILAGLLWSTWGMGVLMSVRILLALGAEAYVMLAMRRLEHVESSSTPAVERGAIASLATPCSEDGAA